MKKKTKKKSLLPNSNVVNIENYIDKNGNPSIKAKDSWFNLSFYLDSSIIYNNEEYNKFIKAVEKKVRESDFYKDYIATLKLQYGLNFCMILGNIDDSDGVDIEMHHGPLMTLYDVVSLIVNDCIANNIKINTFKVTDMVLREHFNNNIQVIMLSKTVHQAVHKGKIFIHPEQCIGNISKLLEKYEDGLTEEMAAGINKYLELSEKYKTTDNGYFKSNEIKKWNKTGEDLNYEEE